MIIPVHPLSRKPRTLLHMKSAIAVVDIDVLKIWMPSFSDSLYQELCREAVVRNRLDIVQLLFKNAKSRLSHSNYFSVACQHNHLDLAKWLFQGMDLSMVTTLYLKDVYYIACLNRHVEIVKWLYGEFVFRNILNTDTIYLLHELVYNTLCSEGALELLKWMHAQMPLWFNTTSIIMAGIKGHFEVIEWIFNEVKNVFINPNELFSNCCTEYGDVEFAKWIYHNIPRYCNFPITITDYLFRGVCLSNCLEIAQWLFEINPSLRVYVWDVLLMCDDKYLKMIQWLHSLGNIEEYMNSTVLEHCCGDPDPPKLVNFVRWFLTTFPKVDVYDALHKIVRKNNTTMALLFQEIYPCTFTVVVQDDKIVHYEIRNVKDRNWYKRKYLIMPSSNLKKNPNSSIILDLPNDLLRHICEWL